MKGGHGAEDHHQRARATTHLAVALPRAGVKCCLAPWGNFSPPTAHRRPLQAPLATRRARADGYSSPAAANRVLVPA